MKNSYLSYLSRKFSKKLLANISVHHTQPGCIVASQSKSDPPYFYHWFRDAALVMLSMMRSSHIHHQRHLLQDWLMFEAECAANLDRSPELSGPGEPKIHVDCTLFTEPWGRPQHDSSALRLIAGLEALERMHQGGFTVYATNQFHSLLMRDVDYTIQTMGKPGFDLWEEVYGCHFFTLAVQCHAMSCAMSSRWLSEELRSRCCTALQQGEQMIQEYLDSTESQAFLQSSRQVTNHNMDERFWCDSSVLLAVCKFRRSLVLNFRTIRTVVALANHFTAIYPINKQQPLPLLGRYPEDKYFGGNPWPICTCFAIDWCFTAATHLLQQHTNLEKVTRVALTELLARFNMVPTDSLGKDRQDLGRLLFELGDAWLSHLLHTMFQAGEDNQDFNFAEQINRLTGEWLSAKQLTWNYAALLDCLHSRECTVSELSK